MEDREAHRVVEEYVGYIPLPPVIRALIIRLVAKDLLDKFDLNFMKRWVRDSGKE